MIGSAMKKTGRPVVLVPLSKGVHTGHISMIRAARGLPRAVVVVAWSGEEIPTDFATEKVDYVWRVSGQPQGVEVSVAPGLENITRDLTRLIALIGALGPSDVVVGDKDYELAAALRRVVVTLHIPVTVHSVPTVRMASGLAVSLRNADVAEEARDQALALSAALTAGAHAAEHGGEKVLEVARGVLEAAGVEPEYLEVRGLDFGPAPDEGDARLLVAATVGGVRLLDNVGLPLGIGFKNISED